MLSDKIVVGLFDSDKDVEEAVTELQSKGFGQEDDDEIQIVDQSRLNFETPVDTSVPSPPGAPDQAAPDAPVLNPISEAGTEAAAIEKQVRETLEEMGVNPEEAFYYANRVAHGARLVVVKTTQSQASEVLDVINKINAKASVA